MAGPQDAVTIRAKPLRAWLLLGGLGIGTIAFLVTIVALFAWYLSYLDVHPTPTSRDIDPGIRLVAAVGILALGGAFILPETLWRSHAFIRYLRGRLWIRVHASGIETGWDGMHTWFQLVDLRLAPWAYTGGRGPAYHTWLLEYRIRGRRRRTIVDLAAFGAPSGIADEIAPVLVGHGSAGGAGWPVPRTWRAGLRWLLPARLSAQG